MALLRHTACRAALLGFTAALMLWIGSSPATAQIGAPKGGGVAPACLPSEMASPYVPLDSWVYPAIMRLYSLGFVDNVYLGLRPWTRLSIEHMIEETGEKIEDAGSTAAADEAEGIYDALLHELHGDTGGPCLSHQGQSRIESTYTVGRYISGTPLRDSYHLGQTIVNDYGRPYASGFNNYTGASGYVSAGHFVLYLRGESQAGPSFTGYSQPLAQILSKDIDGLSFTNLQGQIYTQDTIPYGTFPAFANGRVVEAYLSAHFIGHDISFGKQDEWMGPGVGGGMAYSNNAENIYSFRINRIEPLHIPGLSRLLGPFRYDFMVGSLKGHSSPDNGLVSPNDPWVHAEKISFKPTENVEFGFERTVIWGGKGHEPITVESFLRSFFSVTAPDSAVKSSNKDPGARFGAFDAVWRLPYLHHWMTFYVDSEAHDDISPADAPRRAAFRPGLYLSHLPGVRKLDLRVEGIDTDPSTSRSVGGEFNYYEGIVKQGYTNKGIIFGDWMGREGKGGQAWTTWHLSGNEWIQASWRRQKNAKDFVPGGTTLDDETVQVVKRLTSTLELNASFTHENWLAPVIVGTPPATLYLPGKQTVTTTSFQLTWYPERKVSF
jgi:hypothetical protein